MKTKNLEVIFHPHIPTYEVNGTVDFGNGLILPFASNSGRCLFETEKEARNFMEEEIAKS